ncbi:MAG: hypothetical protein H5T92_10550, partial [Synergistales bacterium]|nr:hypothetical protein [Synergistales bacterium]
MTAGLPKETTDQRNQSGDESTTPSGPLPGFVAALRVAVVAAVFTLVVTALLVWNYVTHLAKDP